MGLKIVSGNFGVTGKAVLDKERQALKITGAHDVAYSREDISSITSEQKNTRQFSPSSLIIGVLIATPLMFFYMGWIGGLITLVVALTSTFYSRQDGVLIITFNDGKKITLQGGPYEVDKFVSYLS